MWRPNTARSTPVCQYILSPCLTWRPGSSEAPGISHDPRIGFASPCGTDVKRSLQTITQTSETKISEMSSVVTRWPRIIHFWSTWAGKPAPASSHYYRRMPKVLEKCSFFHTIRVDSSNFRLLQGGRYRTPKTPYGMTGSKVPRETNGWLSWGWGDYRRLSLVGITDWDP